MTRAGRLFDRVAVWVSKPLLGATVIFLLIPAAFVLLMSFSGEPRIHFPPSSWGLRQYEAFLSSEYWVEAVKTSFSIAIPTAFLALLIGIPAIFAFHRIKIPGRYTFQFAGLSSLLIPITAYSVAMYSVYIQLRLLGTFHGLVIAHTVLAVPFVLTIVGTAINRIPEGLEHAAMNLGASRVRAWLGITMRLLLPALLAAFIFAFLTSFDEAVFVSFLGGAGLITLPKAIFDSIRFTVDALITAISSLLIVGAGILILFAVRLQRGT
jgi:ABC-type spermidine/putrescine transport system permease subunit II